MIELSTGLKEYTISFKGTDKTVSIFLNLADLDLPIRLKNAQKTIGEKLDAVDISDTAVANEKIRNIICEEVDYAFGNNISGELFKYCSPMAMVGNKMFVEQFFDAIVPYIATEMKKSNEKMAKHLEKIKK